MDDDGQTDHAKFSLVWRGEGALITTSCMHAYIQDLGHNMCGIGMYNMKIQLQIAIIVCVDLPH